MSDRDLLSGPAQRLADLEAEVIRLKEGRFTPEEFQNLCHSKTVQDGYEEFYLGCDNYQKQLFGKCRSAELIIEVRAAQRAEDFAKSDREQLHSLIHTPHTDDFMSAVPLEAAFQISHWGVEHDAGKQPEDYFWLIGYLAGKALRAAVKDNDLEKAKHHTISTAAACLNWFRRFTGDDKLFQPGTDQKAIEP